MIDDALRYFLSIATYYVGSDAQTIEAGIELDIQLAQAVARIAGDEKAAKKASKMTIEKELDNRKMQLSEIMGRIDFFEIILGKANGNRPQLMNWSYDVQDKAKYHLITLYNDVLQWVVISGYTTAYTSYVKMLHISSFMDLSEFLEMRTQLFTKLEDKYGDSIFNLTNGMFDY